MKRLLLIVSVILSTTFLAQAQTTPSTQEKGTILRLYPNPAISFITIDFQKSYDRGYSLQVYNFLGRKMYESNNMDQKTTVQLAEFNRGVYIYQLRDRNGQMVESGKFQVSK